MNVRSTARPSGVAPASNRTTRARVIDGAIEGFTPDGTGDAVEVDAHDVLTTRRMLDEYLLYVGDPPAHDGRASLT